MRCRACLRQNHEVVKHIVERGEIVEARTPIPIGEEGGLDYLTWPLPVPLTISKSKVAPEYSKVHRVLHDRIDCPALLRYLKETLTEMQKQVEATYTDDAVAAFPGLATQKELVAADAPTVSELFKAELEKIEERIWAMELDEIAEHEGRDSTDQKPSGVSLSGMTAIAKPKRGVLRAARRTRQEPKKPAETAAPPALVTPAVPAPAFGASIWKSGGDSSTDTTQVHVPDMATGFAAPVPAFGAGAGSAFSTPAGGFGSSMPKPGAAAPFAFPRASNDASSGGGGSSSSNSDNNNATTGFSMGTATRGRSSRKPRGTRR